MFYENQIGCLLLIDNVALLLNDLYIWINTELRHSFNDKSEKKTRSVWYKIQSLDFGFVQTNVGKVEVVIKVVIYNIISYFFPWLFPNEY